MRRIQRVETTIEKGGGKLDSTIKVPCNAAAISGDGKYLAVAKGPFVYVYPLVDQKGTAILKPLDKTDENITAVCFSADCSLLACATDSKITVWHILGGGYTINAKFKKHHQYEGRIKFMGFLEYVKSPTIMWTRGTASILTTNQVFVASVVKETSTIITVGFNVSCFACCWENNEFVVMGHTITKTKQGTLKTGEEQGTLITTDAIGKEKIRELELTLPTDFRASLLSISRPNTFDEGSFTIAAADQTNGIIIVWKIIRSEKRHDLSAGAKESQRPYCNTKIDRREKGQILSLDFSKNSEFLAVAVTGRVGVHDVLNYSMKDSMKTHTVFQTAHSVGDTFVLFRPTTAKVFYVAGNFPKFDQFDTHPSPPEEKDGKEGIQSVLNSTKPTENATTPTTSANPAPNRRTELSKTPTPNPKTASATETTTTANQQPPKATASAGTPIVEAAEPGAAKDRVIRRFREQETNPNEDQSDTGSPTKKANSDEEESTDSDSDTGKFNFGKIDEARRTLLGKRKLNQAEQEEGGEKKKKKKKKGGKKAKKTGLFEVEASESDNDDEEESGEEVSSVSESDNDNEKEPGTKDDNAIKGTNNNDEEEEDPLTKAKIDLMRQQTANLWQKADIVTIHKQMKEFRGKFIDELRMLQRVGAESLNTADKRKKYADACTRAYNARTDFMANLSTFFELMDGAFLDDGKMSQKGLQIFETLSKFKDAFEEDSSICSDLHNTKGTIYDYKGVVDVDKLGDIPEAAAPPLANADDNYQPKDGIERAIIEFRKVDIGNFAWMALGWAKGKIGGRETLKIKGRINGRDLIAQL